MKLKKLGYCLGWGVLFILLAAVTVSVAEKKPVKPGPRDKCPVCGMFVAKYPEWVAQVTYKDDTRFYFDGAKDLFKYLFQVAQYSPGRTRADIEAVWVTDYYNVTLFEASRAYFVVGSDIYGPMGRELVPFLQEADAREFMKDHKGKKIFRFPEVTPAVVKGLD